MRGRREIHAAEACARRPADAAGPGPPRAAAQAGRARRLLLRRALVRRLRDGRDPPHPRAGRDRRAALLGPDRAGHHRAARDRHGLLPADDPRLSQRRRLLHRRPGQPRDGGGAGGGGRAARRLRADRLGVGRRGRGGRDVGVARPGAPQGGDRRRVRGRHRARQHPRRARVGAHLRRPDLFLHRVVRLDDHRGLLSAGHRQPAQDAAAGPARGGDADVVPDPPRVLVRVHGDDGDGSDLERHPGLPAAGIPQRRHHPRLDGRDPGHVLRRPDCARGPLGVVPVPEETVVSQIARRLHGTGLFYYAIQAATALILVLAANTSFADFPRLSSLLARDRFVPRQFANLGERLVFSNGIMVLGGLAALLLVVFGGETHALIPLYAVGVFISFTLSQSGMVRRWWHRREPGWRHRLAINGVGAVTTGIVTLVIAATKFTHGAWIVVLVVPTLVATFMAIRRHYDDVAEQLSLEGLARPPELRHTVLVIVGDLHRGVVRAVQYAKTLAAPSVAVRAVFVETDPAKTAKLEEKWARWGLGVPLVILNSPYRSLLRPLVEYLDALQAQGDDHMVTVVIPEFLPSKWWQHVLHNQTALLVKGTLLFRKNTVVVDVPYLLKR